MRYELYIDSLIFTNYVMNLYLLFLVNASTLRTATPGKLLGGAAVGAVGFILPFLGGNTSVLWLGAGTFLGVVGMLCLTFPVRSIKMFFKLFERLLVFSFAMGGGMLFLIRAFPNVRSYLTNALALVAMGGLLFRILYRARFGKSGSTLCKAILIKGDERIELPALIDSGNSLVEPISGQPVCVVEKRALQGSSIQEMEHFRAIPYHSVGKKHGVLPGYRLPGLEVWVDDMIYKFKDVYIAVSDETVEGGEGLGDESIKMIMNPLLFEKRKRSRKHGRM